MSLTLLIILGTILYDIVILQETIHTLPTVRRIFPVGSLVDQQVMGIISSGKDDNLQTARFSTNEKNTLRFSSTKNLTETNQKASSPNSIVYKKSFHKSHKDPRNVFRSPDNTYDKCIVEEKNSNLNKISNSGLDNLSFNNQTQNNHCKKFGSC